jgi:hypothetical protein
MKLSSRSQQAAVPYVAGNVMKTIEALCCSRPHFLGSILACHSNRIRRIISQTDRLMLEAIIGFIECQRLIR